jgi:hypothetical protein
MLNKIFFLIMSLWDNVENMVQPDQPQMTK